jgi:hypothetical protein
MQLQLVKQNLLKLHCVKSPSIYKVDTKSKRAGPLMGDDGAGHALVALKQLLQVVAQ